MSAPDFVTQEDVDKQINLFEWLQSGLEIEDDFLRAILANQTAIGAQIASMGKSGSAGIDLNNLPNGMVGVAAEDIHDNSSGSAIFSIDGSRFMVQVTAERQNVDAGRFVIINGEGNKVVEGPKSLPDVNVILSGGSTGVSVDDDLISPDQTIRLANESWVNTSSGLNPAITQSSFTGDLDPGDEENVVEAREEADNRRLQVKAVGVTSHKADIDGDKKDESVVNYKHQYQTEVGGSWITAEGPSGVIPLGDTANAVEYVPGEFIGPVVGWRVRFENRTDDASFTDSTVPEEDIGAILVARSVEV